MINYGFWMDVRGTHSWTNPSTCASCRPGAKSKAKVKKCCGARGTNPTGCETMLVGILI